MFKRSDKADTLSTKYRLIMEGGGKKKNISFEKKFFLEKIFLKEKKIF